MAELNIALVRCCSNLNSPNFRGDLQHFRNALSSAGIQYKISAWDDPNVEWKQYSTIILTSEIDYDKNIDKFLNWISEIKQLSVKIWNPPEVIYWNYNKEYLLELQSKNIRIPETLLVKDVKENLSSWLEERFDIFGKNKMDVKVVVKNVICAGGKSVWSSDLIKMENGGYKMKASDVEKLQQQILSLEDKSGVLIQKYLPAILTEGEWSLLYFNRVFSHAVVKKPRASVNEKIDNNTEFRVHARYGGSFEPVQLENVPDKLIKFADSVLETISEPLLHARIDIVNAPDEEPCLMEFEVLDPLLFQTEPVHGERYLQALLCITDEGIH